MQQAVRFPGASLFPVTIALILFAFVFAQTSPSLAAGKRRATLILDLSSSMAKSIGGTISKTSILGNSDNSSTTSSRKRGKSQSRIGEVQKILGKAYKSFGPRINLGIVAFGHRKSGSCSDFQSIKSVGRINPAQYRKATNALRPIGISPITGALKLAAQKADYKNRANTFILVTDSEDSCSANPCQYGAELRNSGANITVHVIAIGLSRAQQKDLRCLAGHTRGHFFSVSSKGQLTKALYSALNGVSISSLLKPEPAPSADIITAAEGKNVGASQIARITGKVPLPRRKPTPPGKTATAMAAPDVTPPATMPKPQAIASKMVAAKIEDKAAEAVTSLPVKKSMLPVSKPKLENLAARIPPVTPAMVPSAPPAITRSPQTGQLDAVARIIEGAGPMTAGVSWTVYSASDGMPAQQITGSKNGHPVFKLPAGNYIIEAALGLARMQTSASVINGQKTSKDLVFNAGGLKLSSLISGGTKGKKAKTSYIIKNAEGRVIAKNIGTGQIIHLNAGTYGVTSKYGTANSIINAKIDVLAGKLTEATLNHDAGRVTFKLAQNHGAEPFSGVEWKITKSDGETIVTSQNSTPSYILANGTYKAIAKHDGKVYRSSFIVRPGEDKTKEVTTE